MTQLALSTTSRSACLLGFSALLWSSASYAADPTTADCLAASEDSISLRNRHQFRAARSALLVCAAETCPTDVRDECTRRVAELNLAMPTIVFHATDAAGHDLTAVKVSVDGQPLLDRLEGTAFSIDPGEHVFVFETAGHTPVQKRLLVVQGVKNRRERVEFGTSPAAAVALPASTQATAEPGASETEQRSSLHPQAIAGYALTGAGAIGIGLGVFFQVQRANKLSDRDKICPSGVDCPSGSQSQIDALTDDARSASTLGWVSLVAGGACVAGGLALVFTAPRSTTPQTGFVSGSLALTPMITPTTQGVSFSGQVW